MRPTALLSAHLVELLMIELKMLVLLASILNQLQTLLRWGGFEPPTFSL